MAATLDFTPRSRSTRLLLKARTPHRTESDASATVDFGLPGVLAISARCLTSLCLLPC
jgi:hypothetical protein